MRGKRESFYYEEGKLDEKLSSIRDEKDSSSMCELSHKSEKHAAKWASFSSYSSVYLKGSWEGGKWASR